MFNFLKILVSCSFFILLTACGGGSSGGSSAPPTNGGGGSGGSTSSLQVSSTSVRFQSRQFQDLPPTQTINVTASGSNVTQLIAGYAPGVTPAEWLSVNFTGTVNSSTLTLGIATNTIAFGTYTVPLRVITATAADVVIDTVDITVTFQLEQGKSLGVDKSEIIVRTIPRANPVVETVTISALGLRSGETINWNRVLAGVSGEGRVTVDPESGTLGVGDSQVVEVTIAAQDSGVASTTFIPIDFSAGDDARGSSLTVRANSIDGLFSDPAIANLTIEEGETVARSVSVIIKRARSGTGTLEDWQAVADQGWVTLTKSGTFDLEISVDPTSLTAGRNEATVTITHGISDQVLEIPVVVIISGPTLKASQRGVALSNLSNLDQQLVISDSNDNLVSWSASSSASWLTVTPSGNPGDPLTLMANTSGLAVNSLVLTDVIISSADLPNDVNVQVGLWVGDTIENRVSVNVASSASDLARAKRNIVADPVRPYVYVKKDRANAVRSTDLSIFNVYTGEKVGESLLVDVDPNGDILISDDGRYLYIAGDNGTGSDTRSVAKIDLTDMNSKIISLLPGFLFSDVVFARVKSQAVLISSRGIVMDTETEEVVSTLPSPGGTTSIRVSQNGKTQCLGYDANFGGEFECVNLIGSGLVGAPISSTPIPGGNIAGGDFRLGIVFEISSDGEDLLFRKTTNTGDEFHSIRLADRNQNFTLALNPTDLSIDSAGNILVATTGPDANLQANKYDRNGVLLASEFYSSSIRPDSADTIVLSGDESRTIQLFEEDLYFMPTPSN